LRGRAGRQGDPGSSRFFLSLEDDLMRIFGSERISGLMQRLGMEEGIPIEHKMVTKAIERAQKQVESQNFSVRKHLLQYDDVMNKQRESVYALRRELLDGQIAVGENGDATAVDTRGYLMMLAEDMLDGLVETYAGRHVNPEEWDVGALTKAAAEVFALDVKELTADGFENESPAELREAIWTKAVEHYDAKTQLLDSSILRRVERDIMLQIVDSQWKDHLYSLDHLKEGIALRGYGQRDPLVEYKRESFQLFQAMKERIDEESVRYLWRLQPVLQSGQEGAAAQRPAVRRTAPPPVPNAPAAASPFAAPPAGAKAPRPARTGGDDVVKTVRRDEPKVGRNDPCPCGSGKKYKKCHGA
jgi:preprotein translocase subunit SecA